MLPTGNNSIIVNTTIPAKARAQRAAGLGI